MLFDPGKLDSDDALNSNIIPFDHIVTCQDQTLETDIKLI